MSEERKAKAAARRAAKKEKKITAFEAKPIEIPEVTPTIEKPNDTLDIKPRQITFSDMLEGQRRKITQDKTDAAKMQKYYALADVMKALGQMGGAAIGGSIGGNALDSAPKVDEYKESRGYIDAFEKAKKANDRLRALDEKEFSLNYAKQQKDEERAYQKELRDEERAYRGKIADAERKFKAEQAELERKIKVATAKEKVELEKAKLESKQKHEREMKELSLEMVKLQMGYSEKDRMPIAFKNGQSTYIPAPIYKAMTNYFIGDTWDGKKITKDNVNQYIINNQGPVNDFLKRFGYGFSDDGVETKQEKVESSNNQAFNPNITLIGNDLPFYQYAEREYNNDSFDSVNQTPASRYTAFKRKK